MSRAEWIGKDKHRLTSVDFSAAKDFNLTCERLNAYEVRELVVSKKVRDIFTANKIRVYGNKPVVLL
jgi:hypothetical protein